MKTKILFIFLQFFLCFELLAQLNMVEVQPGLFVHQGKHLDIEEGYDGDICNIGFIIGKQSIAVIDTGGNLKIGQDLLSEIRRRSDLPIHYVINTHVHLDHIYGNAAFLEEGATYLGHENLPKAMQLRKAFYEKLNLDFMGIKSNESIQIRPSQTIKTNEEIIIDLGDRPLKIKAFPEAHTNTDITILDINSKTLWTGDLLFVERTPVIDGDIHGFIDVLSALEKENYNMVVPGHGTPSKNPEQAFAKIKAYLKKLRDEIRLAIDSGMGLDEATQTLVQDESTNWVLFNIQNARNINRVFPMMEWE